MLQNSFPDLKYEVIKASKQGSPVRAYRFSFTPEAPDRQLTIEEWQNGRDAAKRETATKKNKFSDIIQSDYSGISEDDLIDN